VLAYGCDRLAPLIADPVHRDWAARTLSVLVHESVLAWLDVGAWAKSGRHRDGQQLRCPDLLGNRLAVGPQTDNSNLCL
jgi:hypothetical protein